MAAEAYGYVVVWEPLKDLAVASNQEFQRQRVDMLRVARRAGRRLGRIPFEAFGGVAPRLSRRPRLVEAVGLARLQRAAFVMKDLRDLRLSDVELATFVLGLKRWSVTLLETSPAETAPSDYAGWARDILSRDQTAAQRARSEFTEFAKATCRSANRTKRGRKRFGESDNERRALERIWFLRKKPKHGPRLSYGRIASILNDMGIRPQKARNWSARTVQVLVRRTRPHLD